MDNSAKANARALKAANAPTRASNMNVVANKTDIEEVRRTLKILPPRNPNVTRAETAPTRTSGLQGKSGVLGGQHAGGHSDVAGGFDEPLGGGGLGVNPFNK
jgi:hypothetical protein